MDSDQGTPLNADDGDFPRTSLDTFESLKWKGGGGRVSSIAQHALAYKAQRDRAEGQQLVQLGALHRRQDDELFRYHNDKHCATPVSDDVGIILGKLHELALEEHIPQLTALVEDLVRAIDAQLTGFYRHMRGDDTLVELAPKVKPFAADEALAELQRRAASEAEQKKGHKGGGSPGNVTGDGAFGNGGGGQQQANVAEVDDVLSATTCLLAEALATTLHAEEVRMYLLDADGHGLKFVASFPPPAPELMGSGGVIDRSLELHRALQSAVFQKGMAVAGHDTKLFTLPSAGNEQSTNDAADAFAPRNCLVWPVLNHRGASVATSKALGVIEVRNKESADSEERKRFSEEDECIVHVASRLFAAMLNRYDVHWFAKNVMTAFAAMTRPLGIVPPHLPEVLHSEVVGAEQVANRCIRRAEPLVVYRGPTSTIHRPASLSKKSDVFSSASSATADLNSVEYALDSLHDMWRTAYKENVAMHEQSRRWAVQVKELTAITKTFQEALVAAHGIETVDDLHMYIRSLELSLKSGSSRTVRNLVEKTVASNTTSPTAITGGEGSSGASPTVDDAAAKSTNNAVRKSVAVGNPIADMYVEGPQNVRTYTVDPEAKREQLRAIEQMIAKADHERAAQGLRVERRCFAMTEARSGKVATKFVAPPLRGSSASSGARRPQPPARAGPRDAEQHTPFRLHLKSSSALPV